MKLRRHRLLESALAILFGALFGYVVGASLKGVLERERQAVSLAVVAEDGERGEGRLTALVVADDHTLRSIEGATFDGAHFFLQDLTVNDPHAANVESRLAIDGAPKLGGIGVIGVGVADVPALFDDHLANLDTGLRRILRRIVAGRHAERVNGKQDACGSPHPSSHGVRRLAPWA